MTTVEQANQEIASINEQLDSYKEVDYEWGSPTHRHIDYLEGRLEELHYYLRDLTPDPSALSDEVLTEMGKF